MAETRLICVSCPVGCQLAVRRAEDGTLEVTGNQCRRGIPYAEAETTRPVRAVSSTVRLRGAALAALPVKTASPVPKDRVRDCVRELRGISANAPVKAGDVILADVCGTGVDVVATRGVDKA